MHWEQSEGTFNVSVWLAGTNLTALLDESKNSPLKWTGKSSQDGCLVFKKVDYKVWIVFLFILAQTNYTMKIFIVHVEFCWSVV